jgi:hypothetical protein
MRLGRPFRQEQSYRKLLSLLLLLSFFFLIYYNPTQSIACARRLVKEVTHVTIWPDSSSDYPLRTHTISVCVYYIAIHQRASQDPTECSSTVSVSVTPWTNKWHTGKEIKGPCVVSGSSISCVCIDNVHKRRERERERCLTLLCCYIVCVIS